MEPGLIPHEKIQSLIYQIRGLRVMLDADLATLYRVETKMLKRAVNRNRGRFPDDFMFELSWEECQILRCQNWHLKMGRTHRIPSLRLHGTGCGYALRCAPQ